MAEEINTIIKLPDSPEEVGIVLPPAELRRIDFSALDFETLRRLGYEYIKTYYPQDFNDFVLSNGAIMFMELAAAMSNVLSERSDIIADEAFLPTAQSRTSVSEHLELIGQELRRATPAVTDVECSLGTPVGFDLVIPSGLQFSIPGPDGSEVKYEVFSAPGDYTSDIIVPRGKRGIIAFAVEGAFASPVVRTANGEANQFIDIPEDNVLNDPISVTISSGDDESQWDRIDFLARAEANDEVFEVKHFEEFTRIQFGDNANGKAPIEGQIITVTFRNGGGARGRIGSSVINENRPIGSERFAAVNVQFRNITPSRGGDDEETIEAAKKRAPRTFAIHDNIATSDDYANSASQFSHPTYGNVAKAVATIRTGIEDGDPTEGSPKMDQLVKDIQSASSEDEIRELLQTNYVNRNIVEMYILAEGENTLAAPSKGLKTALQTELSSKNVFTDELRIFDGSLLPIDIEAVITISRNADPGFVKERVLGVINELFDPANRMMGQGFNTDDLVFAIRSVDGVKSVDLFEPADDFPALKRIVTDEERNSGIQGVGVNELVILGNQNIQFFFEQGNLNV